MPTFRDALRNRFHGFLRRYLEQRPEVARELGVGGPSGTVGDGALAQGDRALAVGAGGLGIGKVEGDVVLGDLDRSDPVALERAYLYRLVRDTSSIPLAGVDPGARTEADVHLRLEGIYTALRTREGRPGDEERKLRPEHRPEVSDRPPGSALEWLDAEARLVLLGDPGGGKSTFVNFVAHCLARQRLEPESRSLDALTAPLPQDDGSAGEEAQPWSHQDLLPVRVVLRDFAARGLAPANEGPASARSLWSFLERELRAAELGAYSRHLKRHLREQGGLLLLDGLDEVPEAEARREHLRDAVVEFEKSFPRCRMLVTSRIYPYRNQGWRLPDFSEAVLAPFTEGQIRGFVRRWYGQMVALERLRAEVAEGRARHLEGVIFASRRLLYLAERPLLLTLMASLHAWRGGTLPDKRERLYADTVELLLDFWERQRTVFDAEGKQVLYPALAEWLETDQDRVRQALERLAFEAHDQQETLEGTADLPEGQVVERLMRLRPDGNPSLLVDYLRERAGLLEPRGVGVYTFPHRTFQEYLAACHLTNHGGKPEIVRRATHDPDRWREVALLAGAKLGAGGMSEVWDLAHRLCSGEPSADEAEAWGAQIAGQLLVETASPAEGFDGVFYRSFDRVEGTEQRTLERVRVWLQHLMRSDWPTAERVLAGESLGRLGDPRFDPERGYLPAEPRLGFIEVPGGPFLLGSDPEIDDLTMEWETPQHPVELSDFHISRFPVTVAQFTAFIEATGHTTNPRALEGSLHQPVAYTSWHDARVYCKWLDGELREWARSMPEGTDLCRLLDAGYHVRLPTEAEWEKAARGTDGRIYPWPGAYERDRANDMESGLGRWSPVGCFPGGASPWGVEEMSGNVFEWTSSLWGEDWQKPKWRYPYRMDEGRENVEAPDKVLRVVRGGSFVNDRRNLRCAYRYGDHPGDRNNNLGFRVVLAPFSGL